MKVVFVFSGQGAQSSGMGKDIFERSQAASSIFKEADNTLGWSISDICFNGPDDKLKESRYCQPAIYTMSVACLAAFREHCPNFTPFAAAGLSLGEFAALYAAGVFSFPGGLRLVARRGELMDEACRENDGAMASVLGGDPEVIKQVCEDCDIDVANYNCPGQIVISGLRKKVENAISELKGKGVRKVVPLNVAGAFHSRLMKRAGDKLGEALNNIPMKEPVIPVAQNFIGTWARDIAGIRDNLVRQVAGSVKWEECVKSILATGADTVIEFGPGNVLTGLAKRIAPHIKTYNINGTGGFADFPL